MRGFLVVMLLTVGIFHLGPRSAIASEELMQLSEEYWEADLKENPVGATFQGDHRYDHLMGDNTPEATVRRTEMYSEFLSRAEGLDISDMTEEDLITRTCLIFQLKSRLATISCGLSEWTIDPLRGPQSSLFNIPSVQPLTDKKSGEAMLSRWKAMGPYIDQHVANLRTGLGEGKVAIRDAVDKVLEQIQDHMDTPIEESALMKPALGDLDGWSKEDKEDFRQKIAHECSVVIPGALARYRNFLRDEVLPAARTQDKPGLMHVPGGKDCYEKMILRHTSLDLSAEEIHAIGLEEVAKINDEMRELGAKVLGTSDLEEIHKLLREDPEMHFTSRDEVQEKAEEALGRAAAAMGDWFGITPKAPCEVTRIEPHEEKHSTIAYYRRPPKDGSRPGRYYINTYAPETRPRYEAEALAFHEAIPGHHLQVAISLELEGLPEFRKNQWVTAYGEGWALYTERLSKEMGLYSGDSDLFGMLSYDSWRACRLVVDTGMHALGWSRQQAIDYMFANTVLAENNIKNEVDRYITWPGQALGYKLGQREIFRLRAMAKTRLGSRFDIKKFHDAVLGQGGVDLGTLAAIVERWIEAEERAN